MSLSIAELLSGHTMEFGMSRISSGHARDDVIRVFGSGVGRASGQVPESEGEPMVIEAFLMLNFDCPFIGL